MADDRVHVTCPCCFKTMRVKKAYAGRTGSCNFCASRISIPPVTQLEGSCFVMAVEVGEAPLPTESKKARCVTFMSRILDPSLVLRVIACFIVGLGLLKCLQGSDDGVFLLYLGVYFSATVFLARYRSQHAFLYETAASCAWLGAAFVCMMVFLETDVMAPDSAGNYVIVGHTTGVEEICDAYMQSLPPALRHPALERVMAALYFVAVTYLYCLVVNAIGRGFSRWHSNGAQGGCLVYGGLVASGLVLPVLLIWGAYAVSVFVASTVAELLEE